MRISIDVDEQLVKDVQDRLGKFHRRTPNAIVNALNRAVTNVNSNIKKEVRNEYVIKAGDIQKTLTKRRASRGNLSAEVRSKGNLIGLDKFKVSPKTLQPKRKKPIKVAVKKGELKQLIGAFVADVEGKKVFTRVGDSRLPIRRLFGPSVPQMLGNEEIRQRIDEKGQETFHTRLEHEINRILEKGRVRQ